MYSLSALTAIVSALVLTPLVRMAARHYGLLDHPDGPCKTHQHPMPLGGGVAVLLATVLGVVTVLLAGIASNQSVMDDPGALVPLLLAALVLVGVGLVDDRYRLRGRQKLAGQLLAVGIVIAAGLRIQQLNILDGTVDLGLLAVPFTLFWLLGAVNSINLLDGADGFATTIGIVIAVTIGVIAMVVGDAQGAVVALALAGALGGFLVFNFPPSSIFLGDAGSMFIGLVVGVLAIQGNMKGPATVVLATPVALMAIPILDSSAAVLRRWLTGKKLSVADRRHLHHILQQRGFGPLGMLLCAAFLCSITAVGALGSVVLKNQLCAVISVGAVLGIIWANDLFGVSELALIGSRVKNLAGSLIPSDFRKQSRTVRQTRIGRRDSRICRRIWTQLREFADEHRLSRVQLDLNEQYGQGDAVLWERRHDGRAEDNWQTRLPISTNGKDVGHIELTGCVDAHAARRLLTELGGLVDSLGPHLKDLADQAAISQARERTRRSSNQAAGYSSDELVFDRADIAGIKFDFLPGADVINAIQYWRDRGERHYITLTNPHSVMLCHRDAEMRAATRHAGLTLPDGVGVLLAAKLLGYGRRHRVAGPSLMLEVCHAGQKLSLRHFFYGGAEGIAEQLAEKLQAEFPGLEVAGTFCPPYREMTAKEDEAAVEAINRSRADVVWVGLGAPKQEKWMADHAMGIHATAMIGVGAAFDFHTGNVVWAPWIVRKCGMEWAYRLALEPRRMWRRNLDSPLFLYRTGTQLTRRLARALLGHPAAPRIHGVTWPRDEKPKKRDDNSPVTQDTTLSGPAIASIETALRQ